MNDHTQLSDKETMDKFLPELIAVLTDFLSIGSWSAIEETFARVGLEWREDLEPGWGKPRYVTKVIKDLSKEEIVALTIRCIDNSPEVTGHALQDALWWYQSAGKATLSQITRDRLLESLDGQKLHPTLRPDDFLRTVAQATSVGSVFSPTRYYYTDKNQLMCIRYERYSKDQKEAPCSHKELFESYGFRKWSDPRVFHFLERLVHPEVRIEDDQSNLVDILNKQLIRDGFSLKCTSFISGYGVYTVEALTQGISESPKYLIFASNGHKPEIGFVDAISNKITILKYEEYCLVYDRPIDKNLGLAWEDLVIWWQNSQYFTQIGKENPRKSLGQRLLESMKDSLPERLVFEAYFKVLRPIYEANLPALIPQVYVHYDPVTISMLKKRGEKLRFEKQRMDFLLLLPHGIRVILEIDGIQHYSLNGKPSPETYAVTMRSDRELRVLGYDVYRFAGIELNSKEKAQRVTESFFRQIFDRYGVKQI
jgi:very-short-patch-repair endonuclease